MKEKHGEIIILLFAIIENLSRSILAIQLAQFPMLYADPLIT